MKAQQHYFPFNQYKKLYQRITNCNINCQGDIVEKRLKRLLEKFGIPPENINYAERMITQNNELLFAFLDVFVPVESYFFREKDYLELTLNLVPEKKDLVKILVIPCASGEPVYSLQILAKQKNIKNIEIEGADISPAAIEKAEKGIYAEHSLKNVSMELRQRFFEKEEGHYQVKQELKSNVVFKVKNLVKSNETKKYDIILCRNLLIYFEKDTLQIALEKTANMLKNDGFLIVGKYELPLLRNTHLFNRQTKNKMVFFRKKKCQNC